MTIVNPSREICDVIFLCRSCLGKFGVDVKHSCEFLLQVSAHLRIVHLLRASIILTVVRLLSNFIVNLSADFNEFLQIAIDGRGVRSLRS